MEFLYKLQQIRTPGLTKLMLALTELGGETVFLVLALIVFWCVDKRRGYFMMTVGFVGTVCNQFMKLFCRIPRPWVLDPEFTPVEQALEDASGYSFPSGHSQSAVGTFGGIAYTVKNKWIKGICIAIAVLVPLSRMYIGVHTPADVLVGAAMALVLVIGLRKPVLAQKDKNMKILIAVMLAVSVGFLLYVECFSFPADMDAHNLESGMKNAYTLLGCLVGIAVVYVVDSRYLHFDTSAIWWAQILKILLGLGTVLAIKSGFKAPLEMLLPVYPARAVRYFLIVAWAGIGWPSTFRYFAKLGVKK